MQAILDTLATQSGVTNDLRMLARHETCPVARSYFAKHPPEGFISSVGIGRLRKLGLADGEYGKWRITPLGREVVAALPDEVATDEQIAAGPVRHERRCQCNWCRSRRG